MSVPITSRQAIERWIAAGWTDAEIVARFGDALVEVDDYIYYLRDDPSDRRKFAAKLASIRASMPKRPGRTKGSITVSRAELVAAYHTLAASPPPRRGESVRPTPERIAEFLGRDRRTIVKAIKHYGLDLGAMPPD